MGGGLDDDLVAPIGETRRLEPARLVLGEIVEGDAVAALADLLDEFLRPLTFVQMVCPVFRDLPERRREGRHLPVSADRNEVALRHIERSRLFVLLNQISRFPQVVVTGVHEVRDQDPLLRRGDGGLEIARPGSRAEALGQGFEASHRASNREPADLLAAPASIGPGSLREGVEGVVVPVEAS